LSDIFDILNRVGRLALAYGKIRKLMGLWRAKNKGGNPHSFGGMPDHQLAKKQTAAKQLRPT